MVNLLEEKYEEEFVVTHIGQRYGTATNDTVTTYVHMSIQRKMKTCHSKRS